MGECGARAAKHNINGAGPSPVAEQIRADQITVVSDI